MLQRACCHFEAIRNFQLSVTFVISTQQPVKSPASPTTACLAATGLGAVHRSPDVDMGDSSQARLLLTVDDVTEECDCGMMHSN